MSDREFAYKFFSGTQEAWDDMYRAILEAKKSVYWEIFAIGNNEIGEKFIGLLEQKAKEGIIVKIIVDDLGSFSLSSLQQNRLYLAGSELLIHNKIFKFEFNLYKWFKRIWQRNHRKVLIVDEEIGFVGGVNIMVEEREWDDIHLRLEGRSVRPLLREFGRSYVTSGGDKKNVRHLLHPIKYKEFPSWKKKVNFIFHSPIFNREKSKLKNFYYDLIRSAKQSITLLTPYYLPDKKFIQLITEAKKRGVEISIILPDCPDYKFIQIAAQAFYELSSKAGAKLFFLSKMNHGKAMSIDNKFGFVGSNNFTHRSFYINKETDVLFQEKDMVKDLNNIFEELKSQAIPYNKKNFSENVLVKKFKEWWARRIKKIV